MDAVSSNEMLTFLERFTDGRKLQTQKARYAQINSFFNFVKNNMAPELKIPNQVDAKEVDRVGAIPTRKVAL